MTGPGAYQLTENVREAVGRRVSVVVVNFNGLSGLPRFVASVWASEATPLEVVVVDNGSVDGSREWLSTRTDLVLVESATNLGFGGGCMAGAALAQGDLLLFANPDVALAPDALGALAGNIIAHPSVAIAFPKMVEAHQVHQRAPRLEDVSSAAGAAMLVERANLDDVGGFDDRMFLYFEETDLCWRTRLLGRRVVQDWQAVALHVGHGSGGGPRWSGEQIKNGLLAHLKVRAWPAVGRFALAMVIKTVVRGARYRDRGGLTAWRITAQRVPRVLAERRRLLRAAELEARQELERLCAENDRWRRHYRRRALRETAVFTVRRLLGTVLPPGEDRRRR